MSILKDVLLELFSMFVNDVWLTGAIIFVVAITAVLINVPNLPVLVSGVFLLFGVLTVLLVSVLWRVKNL